MTDKLPSKLDNIEADLKSTIVCSNLNRVCIIHLLNKTENNEMQAERMAYSLGLSHRTVLYHLDVLHDYGLVEVRKFRKRGNMMMRSVWGLKVSNGHLRKVMKDIDKRFEKKKLDRMVKKNTSHQ